MKHKMFSYREYINIIKHFKFLIKDFKNVNKKTKQFCIIRHDVEFSLDRALMIARLDYNLGIKSSFFIQVKNDCYNGISDRGILIIKEILKLKHFIGLHFYFSKTQKNLKVLKFEFKKQTKILETAIGKKIDRFSIHRPSKWILKQDSKIFKPYINTYSKLYFEFREDPKNIKYYSDSNHNWKYGYPKLINKFQKYQILLHPDEWSKEGGGQKENLKKLIQENKQRFIKNMDGEYKTFKRYFKI